MTESIMLSNFETASEFVNLANQYNFPITLSSGAYKADGKSILEVFSLDSTKPIKVVVNDDCSPEFKKKLKKFSA